jgi:hypothetical protein
MAPLVRRCCACSEEPESADVKATISERLLEHAAVRHFLLTFEEQEWPDLLQNLTLLGIQAISLQFGRSARLADLAGIRMLTKWVERNGSWPTSLDQLSRTSASIPTFSDLHRDRSPTPLLSRDRSEALTEGWLSERRRPLRDTSPSGARSPRLLAAGIPRVRPITRLRCRSESASLVTPVDSLTLPVERPSGRLLLRTEPLVTLPERSTSPLRRPSSPERARHKLRETQGLLGHETSTLGAGKVRGGTSSSEEWYATLMSRLRRLGANSGSDGRYSGSEASPRLPLRSSITTVAKEPIVPSLPTFTPSVTTPGIGDFTNMRTEPVPPLASSLSSPGDLMRIRSSSRHLLDAKLQEASFEDEC